MKNLEYKNKALIITVLTIVVAVAVIWFGATAARQLWSIGSQWKDFNKNATATSYSLSRINTSIGYGGFIHHFKNYVLRQDKSLLPLIEKNLQDTYEAIERYNNLSITVEEHNALETLKSVIDVYSEKLELAKRLITTGYSPQEIDAQVRVDDEPALEAIGFLARHAVERSHKIQIKTDSSINEIISFFQWGSLLIPIIILAATVMIMFLRKIIVSNDATQRARKQLDDILLATPDAMIIANKDGHIVRTNVQAEKLFGYSYEELMSMNIEALMPKTMRSGHSALREQYFSSPRMRTMADGTDLTAQAKDGSQIPVEISLSYAELNGESRAIANIRDVSLRKHAEQALRKAHEELEERVQERTAELAAANMELQLEMTERKKAEQDSAQHRERLAHISRVQTMGEMATNIAHEMNQPLAAIESYTQACLRRIEAGSADLPKLTELLDKISAQSNRAGNILHHLRAMVKKHKVEIKQIDLNVLLSDTVKLADMDIKSYDCRLQLDLQTNLPTVEVDHIQIQQVALNLIRNAVDATASLSRDEDKIITITSNRNDQNEVEICVIDHGAGVADSDVGKLFEAFYTTKKSGMGIGLSICHTIIEAHGGNICYIPNPSGGSKFCFTLPVMPAKG